MSIKRPTLPARPRVVVGGAGFGGLSAGKALRSAPVDITVLDRRNFHLFQPLLYQVATASLSPGQISWPVRSVFAGQKNARVLMMEVNSVDLVAQTVSDGNSVIPYDFLVIATGARQAYFGHETWEPFAPGLKTIEDARSLREKLLYAYETTERTSDAEVKRRCLTTVIVGGGATGVEMAGAVAELAHRTLRGEFRNIDPRSMKIILVEAGQKLLPAFPPELSQNCLGSLRAMDIEVRLKSRVTECTARGVSVGDAWIDAATVIWAAGVQASDAANWLDAECDGSHRVVVESDLSVPSRPDVFVIGDTCLAKLDGNPVPGIAPAAKQMGSYVAQVIQARISNSSPPSPFAYRHQGDLAVIGRGSAVVQVGTVSMSGAVGWLFWCLVHVMFLIGFRSRASVAFDWFWSFVTRQRSARLISDGSANPMKSTSANVQAWTGESSKQGGDHAA